MIVVEIGERPAGRLADAVSLGVLARWVPRDEIDAAVAVTGKQAAQVSTVEDTPSWSKRPGPPSRPKGRLRARYDRLVRRFGGYRNLEAKKKTIYAIAHTLAVITWHVLHDGVPYTDLGADFYTRRDDPDREKNRLIAKLTTLGYTVSIEPAA